MRHSYGVAMNNPFREVLAPLRARFDAQRTVVRPVSRIWFALSDTTAFERCIELTLKWMQEHSQVPLPAEAWQGQGFDVSDVLGANPTKAVRIDATDGSIWAARLDDSPDPQQPRTWVSEFFAEKRVGHLARFGAQLTCVVRGSASPYDVSRPSVVRHVLESLSAEADGHALSDVAVRIDDADIPSLEALLYEPARRLPVVAISESEDGQTCIEPNATARQVGGAAHIVRLTPAASWELTRSVGKRMSVFNGAVRLYLPGLAVENEDPYQHPLWLLGDHDGGELVKRIAARVLPLAFLQVAQTSDFPRFSMLRDVAARHAIAHRPSRSDLEEVRRELANLKLQHCELEEERDSWQSLALEEQEKRRASDADLERLKEDNKKLQSKNEALDHALRSRGDVAQSAAPGPRQLASYEDIDDWAEEVLGAHVRIHPGAIKDCRKNGHNSMLWRVEAALLIIRDYVVPARIHGGLDRQNESRNKLAEIGMEDTPCFVDRDEAKRTIGYTVQYEGEKRVLNDHIKFGNGYDNANQIRIYYFWDTARQRFVIGKMPSHLRNNLTN